MRISPSLRLATWLHSALADRLRRLRRSPDAGLETADKILWAAGIIVIAGAVIGVFRDDIETYATSVMATLGL
ncbi:hypothetical protein Raf01_42730 [Rugosimonospora africana]|uniref:Uncharacterized protein n=2 Tax=Rugosimonospora africana TaxID=556532 RepID=A0A8J3QWP1_9ACTN|nr:hypothetical protein Raf01_42730 [Rugosimonospora africana]